MQSIIFEYGIECEVEKKRNFAQKNPDAMNKRIFFLLMSLLLSICSWGQRADSIAAALLNDSRWFELQDLYRADSTEMSPFLRLFSKTMLHHVYNQPRAAADDIVGLIRGYQTEMGPGTTFTMMGMLISDYADGGDYAKAATTAKTFADQLEGKADDKMVDGFRRQQSHYGQLAEQPLFLTDSVGRYEVPFLWTKVGESGDSLIHLAGTVNGHSERFVFDTGAGYNVITPELARKYRLHMLGTPVAVKGTKLVKGSTAIADAITVGEVTMRNVPFVVLDVTEGNERIAAATAVFSLILGQPFLQQYGRYTIDNDRQTVTFERNVPRTGARHNLFRTSTLYAEAEHSGKRFAVNFDTGAPKTAFGYAYYKTFAEEIAREGRWDAVGMAGYGGITYESVFRMPHITLCIGDARCTLDDVEVSALPSSNGLSDGYGRLGLDFLRRWHKVVIDNTNMTISVE